MAYASLSSLAQTTHQILNHDQYLISDHEKQQIILLRKQVILLREAFNKFPKQASGLEARIRVAAYKAEDILERFMYDQIWVHYRPATHNLHHLNHHDLETAFEEIDSISQEAADFTMVDAVALGDSTTLRTSSSKQLAPSAGGAAVGLDEDWRKIADLLTGGSSQRRIIPIVGMGGIGKTTLAKKAYDHETFEICAWVTVSQDYKTQNIFSDLLDCFQKVGVGRSGESNECMEEKVHKILKCRKYLIVLDDLWSQNAWDDVSNSFPEDGNGSRIVITTRLEDVATYVDSYNPFHRMCFMAPDQSWDLLRKKVFLSRDCPSDLESIGKWIAGRCGGLPLAVVLVAGMLSTVSETPFSWIQVAKKVNSAGELDKIILLSYTDLPHHSRSCFLYVGAFPEDHEIRASKLIKIWIAEGFVEPISGKSLEEGAADYLEDLVKRSLVLVRKRKSDGKIKSCSLHDLVRDVCRRRAEEEHIQHRVSIAHADLRFLAGAYGSTLRSIICFRPSERSLCALPVFRLLRVLDVVDADRHPLPVQVFDLFLLRYLAFGYPNQIPAAIFKLRNLQTLIICPRYKWDNSMDVQLYLPLEIWRMPQLTHLVSFYAPLPDPKGVASPLETLLTLSIVRRFVCTKKFIEMIPNVKKLGITYSGDTFKKDCQLQNLVFLHQLEKVKLVMKANHARRLKVLPVFPETLRKLTLSGWRFPWKYMETVGSLPNLQVLKLIDQACKGHKWKTKEDQFPSLEFLGIAISKLKNWVTEPSHFPRLKHLVLLRCSQLRKIPNDIGCIPTLESIKVESCNEYLADCVKGIQQEQHDDGNFTLQVHCRYNNRVTVVSEDNCCFI